MQSTTSTMPFAEQSRAVGTEAYPPLEGEDAPVGLVLIDEDLQSGVDDLDLPAHAGEPPCALDEIVPQVDYCPCHDIGLAAGDIIVNVGPSGREASLKAFGRTVVPRVGTSGASFHCIRDRGAYGGMDSVGHLPWHSA